MYPDNDATITTYDLSGADDLALAALQTMATMPEAAMQRIENLHKLQAILGAQLQDDDDTAAKLADAALIFGLEFDGEVSPTGEPLKVFVGPNALKMAAILRVEPRKDIPENDLVYVAITVADWEAHQQAWADAFLILGIASIVISKAPTEEADV